MKQLRSYFSFSFVEWLLWTDAKEVRVLAEVQGCIVEVNYECEGEEPELKKKNEETLVKNRVCLCVTREKEFEIILRRTYSLSESDDGGEDSR